MDLNKIIRDMLAKGMSETQVKENLQELGVEDVDRVFEKATERMHEVNAPTVSKENTTPSDKKKEAMTEFSFTEEGGTAHDLFSDAQKPSNESAEEKPLVRQMSPNQESEKPGFSFTRVSDDGEKEVRVGQPDSFPSVEKSDELMQSVAENSLGDLDAVERKLDDTLALLRALKDVNEKILQSQRDVLLRLK